MLFTHKPREQDGTFDLNLHGHIHSEMREEEIEGMKYDKDINKNVGVDFYNLTPINLDYFTK